jgi:hypothetical protein
MKIATIGLAIAALATTVWVWWGSGVAASRFDIHRTVGFNVSTLPPAGEGSCRALAIDLLDYRGNRGDFQYFRLKRLALSTYLSLVTERSECGAYDHFARENRISINRAILERRRSSGGM